MGSSFAQELKKHYQQERNKFIFKNGMTLQQLAGEMTIDPGVLSKVVNGKRSFTLKQLEAFYEIVSLSSDEQRALDLAARKDRGKPSDLMFADSVSVYDVLDLVDLHLQEIHQVRRSGNPQQAMHMTEPIAVKLNEIVERAVSPRVSGYILKKLANVYYERGRAHKEIALQGSELMAVARSVVFKLRDIGYECQDTAISALADCFLGDTFYISKDYVAAIPLLTRSLNDMIDDDQRLVAARALALSYAYMGEQTAFQKVAVQIQHLIDDSKSLNLHSLCRTIEGLARAQGILRLPTAIQTLQEAWRIYSSIEQDQPEKVPIRKIQLIKSELEIVTTIIPSEKRHLETIGTEGIRLGKAHGYQRHTKQINTLLGRYL